MSTLKNALVHASCFSGNISDNTALDISGNGSHWLLRNSPVNATRDRLDLTGSSTKQAFLPATRGEYRDAFDPFHITDKSFSISCKIEPSALSNDVQTYLFHGNGTGSERSITINYSEPNGNFLVQLDNGGTLLQINTGSAVIRTSPTSYSNKPSRVKKFAKDGGRYNNRFRD